MHFSPRAPIAGLLSFLLCLQGNAVASDVASIRETLAQTQQQLRQLQEKVEALEAALEQQEATPAEPEIVLLSERVDDLEMIAVDVDEKIGSRAVVNSFDSVHLDIGGFFDTAATIAINENGTTASFNRQVFELLAKAKLGEDWELFVAQAFVRDSALTVPDPALGTPPSFANNNSPVKTDTIIAWGQYHHSDALKVQLGRFITPHGIVNIEHFPASLLDAEQPQFLRPFSGQTIFANFTNGLNVQGTKFFGDNRLTYALYGGVWAGNATSGVFGGRLGYSLGDSGITIGLNGVSGDRSSEEQGDRFNGGGVDVLIDRGRLLWKSELFATSEHAGDGRLAYYSQPAIRLSDHWTVFYRYDFLDTGGIGEETREHTAGLVFDPIGNVRLRALYRNRLIKEDIGIAPSDTDILQIGTTFNF